MLPGQDAIYYITAESYLTAKHSPQLEVFNQKGIEVLLLSDQIDEWLINSLTEFDGKKLQSVAKGDLDLSKLGDDTEKKDETAPEDFAELITRMKEALTEKAQDVRLTHRLTTSPSCIVGDDSAMTLQMQKMLQAAGHHMPAPKPIFEINPKHALVIKLKGIEDNTQFKAWAEILFEEALLADGRQLEDPAGFVQRLNRILEQLH
jgi:molecular chaperone HtpG